MRYRIALLALSAILASPQAMAAEKTLGVFGGWHAYSESAGGQTVCYMVTTKLLKSSGPKRGVPYLMITHRPIEASTDVVSYGAGAALDQKRSAWLRVGKSKFELFSVRDISWARDSLTDHKIANALRANPAARFSSYAPIKTGKKGTALRPIDDIFDLKGADAAYRAIGRACGLPQFAAKKKPEAHKHAQKPKRH